MVIGFTSLAKGIEIGALGMGILGLNESIAL